MFLGVSLQCWLHLFTSSLFHQSFSPLILLLFLKYFYFTNFLYRDYFLPGVHFSVVVPRVLRIWERFFSLSGVFYLTIFPDIWHNLLLSRFPWGRRFHLEGSRASHWGSKYRPAHMFVWITQHAAKGIIRRFYLCI